jgi:hypothetical protein
MTAINPPVMIEEIEIEIAGIPVEMEILPKTSLPSALTETKDEIIIAVHQLQILPHILEAYLDRLF